jgi:hypothetical protein
MSELRMTGNPRAWPIDANTSSFGMEEQIFGTA